MPRQGNGTYAPPAGQPVVPATTVSSSIFNALVSDIGTELTKSISTDGQTPMAANLGMGGFKLTNLAPATQPADALRFDQLPNFALATAASIIGFIQAGTGAVLDTVQDELRRTISPDQFGTVFDGAADDALAIQKSINSFAQGSAISIRLTPGKTYYLKTVISTNNRSVVIEGNNAILLISADMTYGVRIVGTNCELRNVQINRASGVTVTAGVFITGLQHVLRNVTSRAQTWPLFILCQDMKESHFSEIRVDNDTTGFTGNIFQFDYCVNNTISDSMLGYCAQAIYGSSAANPTFGYHTEGLLLSNVIIVYANKAVNVDNGTLISISNCCFDFIETIGIFLSNGNSLLVTNTWIASNLTNGFLGIGSGGSVSDVIVTNNTVVRGAAPITGTFGLSLPGLNAKVIGNGFKSGMNGGVVTQATSQVFGNTIEAPGTTISAAATTAGVSGSLSVSADLTVTGSITSGGNKGIYPTALAGTATAGVNGALPAQVFAYAVVNLGGTSYKIPLYNV